ncbi:TPA: phenylalanine--tRNA ligase subunit alpha [archaeon]|uniref:Phenylalanine--tRNA ligase alpha subunit n=1 Tax=Candidatus Naiadarchaeum limnaeum TaxID=2756139 RepID=A0A832V602_9ARCH|nr:phenylalanine--tRNA ligase subunit alpha [Candidatus Naiadarchaeum limnaeum]
MDLHPLEIKVIEGLKKLGGKGSASVVAETAGIEKIQAERFGYSLSQKGLVVLEKKVTEKPKLTEFGKKYLKEGLPEKKIASVLKSGPQTLNELIETTGLSQQEIEACFGILKKNGWAVIRKGDLGIELELTEIGKLESKEKSDLENALEEINTGGFVQGEIVEPLKKRGVVEVGSHYEYKMELKEGAKIEATETGDVVHQLTHEMIKTGAWKEKKLRGYDLKAPVPAFYGGKLHPLTIARNKIRRIFLDLGFEEVEGPLIESSFWNFDALFQPQDHPSRDLQDTFYLKNPSEAKLPARKILDEVKKAHEQGTKDSTGWRYKWNEELAKKSILRTHTTAVTVRALSRIKPPAKVFCIGRTFRNETLDFKHLPEFTQIDGIVADENVTFKDLLGYLKEFFYRLGFEKIRFRPAYFPYTEMSTEPEVYLEERGEWLEMGGSGIFRPEVTEPLGIDVPVLAWGLSLERPIMLKLGLKDIRSFYYFNNLKWLREVGIF